MLLNPNLRHHIHLWLWLVSLDIKGKTNPLKQNSSFSRLLFKLQLILESIFTGSLKDFF